MRLCIKFMKPEKTYLLFVRGEDRDYPVIPGLNRYPVTSITRESLSESLTPSLS